MSYADEPRSPFRGTTICAVKRDGVIAVAGDGQVTMGEHTIMKGTARKVRRIFSGKVVVRDLWEGKEVGTAEGTFTCEKLPCHTTRLYRLSPAK